MALHLDGAATLLPGHVEPSADVAPDARAGTPDLTLVIHDALEACAALWRDFEQTADHTVFQSFGWLSAWMRHVGTRTGTVPAIVVGRDGSGKPLFLMPFAVERGPVVRRLTWLGSCLCDYNAPLLAPGFAAIMCEKRFAALWKRIRAALMADRRFRHDTIILEKMPETVGGQRNPFTWLPVAPNPSGAHVASLFGTWDEYYFEKRSSSTRKNDRTKRKKLGEFGEVCLVEPAGEDELRRTLATLFEQKAGQFARMGVADIFARPGHAEFYADLATNPATGGIAYVSRLDVGDTIAAASFGVIHGSRYYHLVAAYGDGGLARFGPGAAHLRDLIRIAIERGCKEFDFTIGDEAYKREWADRRVALHDLHAAATPAGWAVSRSTRALARMKRCIKQTPALWTAFTRTRALRGWLARRPPSSTAAPPEA